MVIGPLSEVDRMELRKKIKHSNEITRRLSKEYERKYGWRSKYSMWGFILGFVTGIIVTVFVIKLGLTFPI